jgi:AcrR family transcriptional regulator
MRKIAKEADLTAMTIYRYFDGKIEILSKIWVQIFADLFDQLEIQIEQAQSPAQRLRVAALSYVKYWLDNREHYFLVFMSKGIQQTDVKGFIEHADTLARFDIFRRCVAEIFPSSSAQALVRLKSELLICTLNGIAQNLITVSSYPWAPPEEIVQQAINGIISTQGDF